MNSETSNADALIFDGLVRQYAATYRHSQLPPFTSQQYDVTSIHDIVKYSNVLLPGVYALYSEGGQLFYIGESSCPSKRIWEHERTARKNSRRPPQRIDLITVTESWERFSLERFLQNKFPDLKGRWDAWMGPEAI